MNSYGGWSFELIYFFFGSSSFSFWDHELALFFFFSSFIFFESAHDPSFAGYLQGIFFPIEWSIYSETMITRDFCGNGTR